MNLDNVDFSGAHIHEAILIRANLTKAHLCPADLSDAILTGSSLVDTNLSGAILTGCSIYGVSAWNVQLKGAKQDNLVITLPNEPIITVDNLEVAQFI